MRMTRTGLATLLGLLTVTAVPTIAAAVVAAPAVADSTAPSFVRFATPLGTVDVELLPQVAPKTVANFLAYVDSGADGSTFIERSVPGFVLQGGGYDVSLANAANPITPVPAGSPVQSESRVSNTRGTRVALGSVRYRASGGHPTTVTLRLSRAGLALLHRGHGPLRARAKLTPTGRPARTGSALLVLAAHRP